MQSGGWGQQGGTKGWGNPRWNEHGVRGESRGCTQRLQKLKHNHKTFTTKQNHEAQSTKTTLFREQQGLSAALGDSTGHGAGRGQLPMGTEGLAQHGHCRSCSGSRWAVMGAGGPWMDPKFIPGGHFHPQISVSLQIIQNPSHWLWE